MSTEHVDTQMRQQAFERLQQLIELHDHLTAEQLRGGFMYEG